MSEKQQDRHIYKIANGEEFQNMKELCESLSISSNQARRLVKRGVIIKLGQNSPEIKFDGYEQYKRREEEV